MSTLIEENGGKIIPEHECFSFQIINKLEQNDIEYQI